MKKLVLLSLTLMVLALSSCKKDTVDVTDLLKSVPSSAAGVIVFNVSGMLEDAGCKVKDHKIQAGPEMEKFLAKKSNIMQENMKVLFEGNTGIEPAGAVVFYDSNRAFLTFALYDTNLFTEYVEKQKGLTFSDEGAGVKVGGNIAVKGAQAWVCLTSGKSIDADAIASYASLGSAQSFLVTPMGEKLLTEEDDIRGWAILKTFFNQVLDRSQRSMFTMGLGFFFENAESVKFKVDFKKGEVEAEAVVLNDKGKPAKYQLPTDKLDVATLKGLGTTCDGMMAFTLTPKLVKKFEKISDALGGALLGSVTDWLKNIDGTVGVISGGEGEGRSFSGVMTTKGEVSQSLKDLISSNLGSISEDGKYLKFSEGDVKGALSVEECAEELKGSCLGFVVSASALANIGYDSSNLEGFKNFIMKMSPESGGIELEFEANTFNEKENALLTILKSAN